MEILFQHIDERGAKSFADVIAERVYADPPLDVDVKQAQLLDPDDAPPQLTPDEASEVLEWLPEDFPENAAQKLEALARGRTS